MFISIELSHKSIELQKQLQADWNSSVKGKVPYQELRYLDGQNCTRARVPTPQELNLDRKNPALHQDDVFKNLTELRW